MATDSAFTALNDNRFLSLTTFRRSGEPVSTPVWIARDGDSLIVTTPAASGKVKRLRNDPRVELRPCSRFGKVEAGAEPVAGLAEILTDATSQDRLEAILRRKYGLEYRIILGIEGLGKRGEGKRLILSIRPA